MSEPDPGSGLGSVPDFVPDSAVSLPLIDLPMSYHLHNTIRYVYVLFFRKSAVRHSNSILLYGYALPDHRLSFSPA